MQQKVRQSLDEMKTPETRRIEKILRSSFPHAEAYRFNWASIRIRIVDERFDNMSRIDREELVLPLIRKLPEKTRRDITMLVLLAPGEESGSLLNLEFEDPRPSGL